MYGICGTSDIYSGGDKSLDHAMQVSLGNYPDYPQLSGLIIRGRVHSSSLSDAFL